MQTLTFNEQTSADIQWLRVGDTCVESQRLPNVDNPTCETNLHLEFVLWEEHGKVALQVHERETEKPSDNPLPFIKVNTYSLGQFPTLETAQRYAKFVYETWNDYGNFVCLPYCEPLN